MQTDAGSVFFDRREGYSCDNRADAVGDEGKVVKVRRHIAVAEVREV